MLKPLKFIQINKSSNYIPRRFASQLHAGRDTVLYFKVSGVLIDFDVKSSRI